MYVIHKLSEHMHIRENHHIKQLKNILQQQDLSYKGKDHTIEEILLPLDILQLDNYIRDC